MTNIRWSKAAVAYGVLAASGTLLAQHKPLTVTPDNFVRAESERYFSGIVKQGGFGKLRHSRTLMPVDSQTVVRPNRDTLYSTGIFDLDAGPVAITMPDSGKRFMSMLVVDADHHARNSQYGAGTYTITRESSPTRYVLVSVRTLVDPGNPDDVKAVHALQDAIRVDQKSSGSFEITEWDAPSRDKVRNALLLLGETIPDTTRMFGQKGVVEPVRHLVGTAIGWGGNSEKDAFYLNVTPAKNNGKTVYQMNLKNVPVDGFWSVSVYNSQGYFEKNNIESYSYNNLTSNIEEDGTTTIQFGGCENSKYSCLPIMDGWNYMVRFFRPREELLDGRWKIPDLIEIN